MFNRTKISKLDYMISVVCSGECRTQSHSGGGASAGDFFEKLYSRAELPFFAKIHPSFVKFIFFWDLNSEADTSPSDPPLMKRIFNEQLVIVLEEFLRPFIKYSCLALLAINSGLSFCAAFAAVRALWQKASAEARCVVAFYSSATSCCGAQLLP